jgi:alpha,alpha-trehalase
MMLAFALILIPAVHASAWIIPVEPNFSRLIAAEDTDRDKKITVKDSGPKRFTLKERGGAGHDIDGTYPLSVVVQELALARESGKNEIELSSAVIFENPVNRTSRLIRELYWDSLTRRVDAQGLQQILGDSKAGTADGFNYLYVPPSDSQALKYFDAVDARLRLKVEPLPVKITGDYVRGLDGRHGLLTLKIGEPFVVPGGRFNEMYGWDSYFIALGLIQDGKIELARSMVDNQVYEITHYGKVLNANRTYYLTRSQPPFLSSMLRAVYERLPATQDNRRWLKAGLEAVIKEYEKVWAAPPRLNAKHQLSRYFDEGLGPCPEVEPGHYDYVMRPYAAKAGVTLERYAQGYMTGAYKNPELDEFFIHDRAVRESGHDTTYRFDSRTADFLTVDLNSLLYKVESDVAAMLVVLGDPAAAEWTRKAAARMERMNALFWDEKRGLFFDFDVKNKKRSTYVSATAFYPLWAGWATPAQAAAVVMNALPELEMMGGLAATSEKSRGPISDLRPQRQWDFPYGWAPHQMLAWKGLQNYGLEADAHRLAYRWLYIITKNARDFNGTVPEKLDVVTGSHELFAEYGNVGTKFSYITKEGFGWMNASYQIGLQLLSAEERARLERMSPSK